MKYLRGKSLQGRKERKCTVAWKRRDLGWGMKFAVCVRVGLTPGTMNNQNGAWRGVLGSGCLPGVEDVCAEGMCKSWVAEQGARG